MRKLQVVYLLSLICGIFLCLVFVNYVTMENYHGNQRPRAPREIGHNLRPEIAKLAYRRFNETSDVDDDVKIIQWFPPPNFLPRDTYLHQMNCGKVRCSVSTRGKYTRHSHAIIFPDEYVQQNVIPFNKAKGVVWILYNNRPPSFENVTSLKMNLKDKSVFNWTISYRGDSDIKISYGMIVKKTAVPQYNMSAIISRKQTKVVALQRSCQTSSRAEDYIRKLRRFIPVDIWGPCNNRMLCNVTKNANCFTRLSRRYKFFLAFEDSLCKDFISDIFFRFYRTNSVAIVRGGADYDNIVPQGTYVNTKNFKSVKQLAEHIRHLDRHDKEYAAILKRKRYYESIYTPYELKKDNKLVDYIYMNMGNMMCDICRRLWNTDEFTKHYHDIMKWYQGFQCHAPKDIK